MTYQIIIEYIGDLFAETYHLYYRESWPGLATLAGVSLLIVVGLLLLRHTCLARLQDRPLSNQADLIFKGAWPRFKLAVIIALRAKFLTGMALLFIIVAWHMTFERWGEGIFLRFDEDRFGILITRFGGADLTEQFGTFGFRDKVASSISHWSQVTPGGELQVRFSGRKFYSQDDAKQYADDLAADMGIWGFGERYGDQITATIGFTTPWDLGVSPAHQPGKTLWVAMPQEATLTNELGAADLSRKIADWVDYIAVHSLITESVIRKDWDGALEYVELGESLRENPNAKDLLFWNTIRVISYHLNEDWLGAIQAGEIADSAMLRCEDLPLDSMGSWMSATSLNLAIAYLMAGDTSGGISALSKAIARDSTNSRAYAHLAQVFSAQNNDSAADSIELAGLSVSPGARLLVGGRATRLLASNTNLAEAATLFEALANRGDSATTASVLLCRCYEQIGQLDSCIAFLERYEAEEGYMPPALRLYQLHALLCLSRITEADSIFNRYAPSEDCIGSAHLDFAFRHFFDGRATIAKEHLMEYCEWKDQSSSDCDSLMVVSWPLLATEIQNALASLFECEN